MNIKIFCHSLVSDWNHGNAHFLRGIAGELLARGHRVEVFEPRDSWSRSNLLSDRGPAAIEQFQSAYPKLSSVTFDENSLDLDSALSEADLVLVHEWSSHSLVAAIGRHRAKSSGYRLLFHDTHHRSVTDPDSMAAYDLSNYDGVLAFGEVVKRIYLERRWTTRAWTWHEAADVKVFHPVPSQEKAGDLVWVGNWGDEERTEELHEFLLRPVKELGLKARVYGVRYPDAALKALESASIEFGGSISNHDVPKIFSQYRLTVHVPRRPYVRALPGIPTIRVFEALACGIPLISAPWNDVEGLFSPGDFRMVGNGKEMTRALAETLACPEKAASQAANGLGTVLKRHTCAHRVEELEAIVGELGAKRKLAGSVR